MAQPEKVWEKVWQFLKEIRKTPIDSNSETQIQKACLQPSISKFADFPDELQKLAKDAFGIAAHAMIEQFIYAKMLPHLKKSINQADLKNGTFGQIVTRLERELGLSSWEAPVELQIKNMSHITANTNADRSIPTCHHSKKPGHHRN